MKDTSDLSRLRNEYAEREKRLAGTNLYSLFNPSYLFTIQQRQRSVLRSLKSAGLAPLENQKILEIGCGSGGVLLEYIVAGAQQKNIYGIDLLRNRLCEAHEKLPNVGFVNSDGQALPFASESFDLVLQYTAFTSVLDDGVKANMANEMIRVLKPAGAIVWYDFWLNPKNPETRGIRPSEIKRLFPKTKYHFLKITLAPPITRRLVPLSWLAAYVLEKLTIFNTHYLVVIKK